MKKWIWKFIESGIWLIPLIYFGLRWYLLKEYPALLEAENAEMLLMAVSLLPTMYVLAESGLKATAEEGLQGREHALRPPVDKKYLFDKPTGIVMGRWKGKYVCCPLGTKGNEAPHAFVLGGSGSGKSSALVIPTLLANQTGDDGTGPRVFAVDIKGELSYKSTHLDSPYVRIFSPQDRSQYGYNPFYDLGPDSTNQEILVVMQTIAESLIPVPADTKDPFWKTSSKNLLTGLLICFYKQGTTEFVSIVDKILGAPIDKTIKEAMATASPSSAEYRYLVQFDGMAEETMGGILAEMNNHLVIFANDADIRYAFKDNPRRCCPKDLDNGYSVYLSIPEHKLSAYQDILLLIITQTLKEMEQRPEDSGTIIFVIDELSRILSSGKFPLIDAARTLRSRNVFLLLISQSFEGLRSGFSEAEVDDLLSNMSWKIVLSASSQKTQKEVINWCGKFRQKKTTWSGSGKKRSANISYEEHDIIEPADLMTLATGEKPEVIVIGPKGYSRIQKCPYYKDKKLKPMADEVISYNRALKEVSEGFSAEDKMEINNKNHFGGNTNEKYKN